MKLRAYESTDWPRICVIHDAARIHELRASGLLLYLHPTRQRQGIGRRLLQHVVAASGGEVSTEVLVGNEAALALYLSEDFKVQERVDGKLAGNESFSASGYVLQRP